MGHGTSRRNQVLFISVVFLCLMISDASAIKYVWKTGLWMECRHTRCGPGGHQNRFVFCGQEGDNKYHEFDTSKCSHLPKPNTKQECFKVCSMHHDQLQWRYTEWSECTLSRLYRTCAVRHGMRYRNVTCHWQTTKLIENNRVCAEVEPEPESREQCNLKCPQDCVVSIFGPWKNCDNCLLLNRTRSRLQIVPPMNGGKECPAFTEMKPCDNCTETYTYQIGPWGKCTAFDEYWRRRDNIHPLLGFQERDIQCINSSGTIVPYTHCIKTIRSSVTELYNRQTCIIPQDCVVSEWSPMVPLSTSCYRPDHTRQPGYMKRTRSVLKAQRGSGKPCPNLVHFFEVQASEEKPCPRTYWKTSSWSECLVPSGVSSCMTGMQTRSIICVEQYEYGLEKPVADDQCSDKRPVTAQVCHAECDMDCSVSHWTEWTECKVTECELYLRRRRMEEGTGQRYRSREVLQEQWGNGKRCPHLSETQTCDPEPCYNWIMMVGNCSLTNPNRSPPCGLGRAHRTLACVNKRESRVHNSKCEELGETPEAQEDCEIPCPSDCIVSPWSEWTQCPNLCQEGRTSAFIQSRERTILAQAGPNGKQCPASRQLSEVRSCSTVIECAVYVWRVEAWSRCTVNKPSQVCGPGKQAREVSCYSLKGTLNSDERCTLSLKPKTTQPCNVPCPVNCELTEFSDWSECSATCLEAKQTIPVKTRKRFITQHPMYGGSPCSLRLTETTQCTNLSLCETFYWDTGQWGHCVLPLQQIPRCGRGLQARDVVCKSMNNTMMPYDMCLHHVGPPPPEVKPCFKTCDEECQFQEWSNWSDCVKGCNGNRFRTRKLIVDERYPPNLKCRDPRLYPVDSFERCLCDKHQPVAIGNWSECILEPMDSFFQAQRTFSGHSSYVQYGSEKEVTPPLPGTVGSNAVCGEGRTYKVFACKNDKGEVEAAKLCSLRPYKEEVCLIPCPVDCVMSDWSPWGDCSTSCGTGTQFRYRHIKQIPNEGGRQCPSIQKNGKQTQQTQTRICTIDCTQYKWRTYKWSPCIPSHHSNWCGNGTQTRTVNCEVIPTTDFSNNIPESRCYDQPKPHIRQLCYAPCDQECVVSEWSAWSRCKQPCANPNQVQSRTRNVLREPSPDPKFRCPNLLEERFCTHGDACIDYTWDESDWTDCLVNSGEHECGFGHQQRYPICRDNTNRIVESELCLEALGEYDKETMMSCEIPCDTDCLLTQWSSWSSCTQTCGLGNQIRTREIVQETRGNGQPCPATLTQSKPCLQKGCYTWVVSDWSPCNKQHGLCGHGIQTRNITCQSDTGHAVNNSKCGPDLDITILERERPCSLPCPGECIISEWSEWNDCFIDCKDFDRNEYRHGVQSRSRAILAHAQVGKSPCPTQLWESRPCQANDCFTFRWKTSNWTATKSREVWCERSDGLQVTGGCPEIQRPSLSLSCNPECTVPNSYCNNTNFCTCLPKYKAITNRLDVLIECQKMDNVTSATPSPKSVTVPADGATNIWMYAVIAAGTLFVIFLAVACYTMSEFFHKGPRPRKKDEEKSLEGAGDRDGMIEETEFASCNHVPPVASVAEVDKISVISADRSSSPSVRALACNGNAATLSQPSNNAFQNGFDMNGLCTCRHGMPSDKVRHHLSSFTHEADNDLYARPSRNGKSLHVPLCEPPGQCNMHDNVELCEVKPFSTGPGETALNNPENSAEFIKPRSSSTLNSAASVLPLYAEVDRNGNVTSALKSVPNPVQKPIRMDHNRKKNTALHSVSKTSLSGKSDSRNPSCDSLSVEGEITETNDMSGKGEDEPDTAVKVVYMNRKESEPEIELPKDLTSSDSLKDMLKSYFSSITPELPRKTVNHTKEEEEEDMESSSEEEDENDPLLDKSEDSATDMDRRRRSSLIYSKCHSLDNAKFHHHNQSNMSSPLYDSDDSTGKTRSLRSQTSVRSRLSCLSVSNGPSIHIKPDIDLDQARKPPKVSHRNMGSPLQRNPNIGYSAFSSFDTETSTAPSSSVSCESIPSPRSLPSESQSDQSMADHCKYKGHDNYIEKSARNVAMGSLKQGKVKHSKKINTETDKDSGVGMQFDGASKTTNGNKKKSSDDKQKLSLPLINVRRPSKDGPETDGQIQNGADSGISSEGTGHGNTLLTPFHFLDVQAKRQTFVSQMGKSHHIDSTDV